MGFWNWFRRKKEPTLQKSYQVLHEGRPIATLTHPEIPDQFWISFQLTPLTQDPQILDLLYRDNSWDQTTLTIRETDSGLPVTFLLGLDWIETEEEVIAVELLAKRPERISLRGPYKR